MSTGQGQVGRVRVCMCVVETVCLAIERRSWRNDGEIGRPCRGSDLMTNLTQTLISFSMSRSHFPFLSRSDDVKTDCNGNLLYSIDL